jgi:hypothetical protein
MEVKLDQRACVSGGYGYWGICLRLLETVIRPSRVCTRCHEDHVAAKARMVMVLLSDAYVLWCSE